MMRQAVCCVLAVIQGDKFQRGDRLDGNHIIFSSAFGFAGLLVRLGGRYPDPAPEAEGKCRLNRLEKYHFPHARCIPALLCAGGEDRGLKPSGGDVLKPRKRLSVAVSGKSPEQPSPNRWTFSMFSEGRPGQNPPRSRLSGCVAGKATDGH